MCCQVRMWQNGILLHVHKLFHEDYWAAFCNKFGGSICCIIADFTAGVINVVKCATSYIQE